MVALSCPLCCNETFSSRSLLKEHIVNILENLICPSCNDSFENLEDLITHLENDCSNISLIEADEQSEFGSSSALVKIEMPDVGNNEEKENDIEDSILARALLSSGKIEGEGMEESTTDENDGSAEYFCQICSVHFNNIEAHLEEYHEGQEVVLEEDTAESAETLEEETENPTVFVINSPKEILNANPETSEENNKEIITQTTPKFMSPKKLNTITQQEFKDKDGRLYTRKFVKIDKFWLQENDNGDVKEPIIQKFLITDGEVKNITHEEAEELENKSAIIEINECPNCSSLFSDFDLYAKHKCPDGGKLQCSHCMSIFADPDSLREHCKVHVKQNVEKKQDGPSNCDICNTNFPSFKSLRLHRRMHDPIKVRELESDGNVDQIFVCNICNRSYDKQFEEIHMSSHYGSNSLNCSKCNRKFFTKSSLDMHMKAHTNNKKFACSYCKKPFVTYDALEQHLLNQCQKRSYACQFCGRRFARPHEKVKHERIHTGEKPHVCEICGKAFRVSYCLTLHLRTHSGARPYECTNCGKRFKSHSVYNHHLLTHSDVRAYKCPYCPKAFKTSVQLAGHKNSHTKPFSCTECSRPFASLYAVRAHMETHKRNNNLKYQCPVCGALYSRMSPLKDHLKQQHPDTEVDRAVVLNVDEEIDAASSILVKEHDIILGLDGDDIEIIQNENE